jgi:hypothetical protein
MTVVKEISEYELDVVGMQEIRWDEVAPNQEVNIHFSMERGLKIIN